MEGHKLACEQAQARGLGLFGRGWGGGAGGARACSDVSRI